MVYPITLPSFNISYPNKSSLFSESISNDKVFVLSSSFILDLTFTLRFSLNPLPL